MAIGNATLCSFEWTGTTVDCFDSNSNATVQKIRQCDQEETPFLVLLIAVVVVFNLASLLATLRLNRIINYVELYKSSKTFLGCRTQPILHRAAVFQLIESDTKDIKLFEEIFQDGNDLSNFLNRPNTLGRTPLHNACERLSSQKCFQLINSGAKFLHDSHGEDPLWESHYFALKISERPEHVALLEETMEKEHFSSFINSNPSMMKDFNSLTMSEEVDDVKRFERILAGRNPLTFINQPSKETGSTPLHAACQVGSPRKAFLLLEAGAQLQADSRGEKPKVENLFKGSQFTPSQEELNQMKTYEEALFSKLISSVGPGGWSKGILHVVERPHLVHLLRSWESADDATKEEAERKVLEGFGGNIKMISIHLPPALGGEVREGLVEIVGKWNSSHSNKCEYLLFRLTAISRGRKNMCWLHC